MANYWITNNAKFRPFSYDEMIKPVERMYTEHSKIEEGLSELQAKAGIWEGLANQQSDPETYAQYKRYADELRLAANDLAVNGLNATSRQNLFNMKARYANEIVPIEQAYTRREKLAEEQRKLNAQSGFNTRFDNDFSTISLDKLMANPQLSYTGINGDEVVKRTSSMASSIAKAISRMPEFVTSPNAEVNKQYFMQKLQQGATIEEVLAEITGKEGAPEELASIRRTIKSQLADNPAYDEDWVNSLINQGMYSAIGNASYDLVPDKSYASPLQWANYNLDKRRVDMQGEELQLQKDKFEFEKTKYNNPSGYEGTDAVVSPTGEVLIPEKTASGKSTGRYLGTKSKKYYNQDGSLHTKQKPLSEEEIRAIEDGGTFKETRDISRTPNVPFKGLHYTRNILRKKWDGGKDEGFDPNDAKIVDASSMDLINKDKVASDLAAYGLTFDDVYIYKDYDWYNDTHYRVVPKNAPASWSYGEVIPEALDTE